MWGISKDLRLDPGESSIQAHMFTDFDCVFQPCEFEHLIRQNAEE